MRTRRVPPVHQSPTEKVRRLEWLLRRLTRSPLAEHTDLPRKAPGNAAFSGPRFGVSKTPKRGRVDWLGDQDSNLNDPSHNPLKYLDNFKGRLSRDRNVSRGSNIPQRRE